MIIPNHYRLSTDALAKWIEGNLQPDTYIVAHLQRSVLGEPGTREKYDKVAAAFMKDLTIALLGETLFRRRKPGKRLVANCITLEGVERPHFNILIRRPEWLPLEPFGMCAERIWQKSPWSKPDASAFWCAEREAGTNVTGYSLKEGTEALLARSLSFEGC